ncbi:MAG: hypothetical protein GY749_04080 [Desulfobacteraceae bacterium]|nr:hypothetical protein [Desulfobacteraceae bacterium]
MVKLIPIELEDGSTIMIESTEDIAEPSVEVGEPTPEEEALISKDGMDVTIQKFKDIEGTIRDYTEHTLNAFKQIAVANIDKVTLEFGIKVGGEAGIPYVTKGTAESNLKVTVECSFPNRETQGE